MVQKEQSFHSVFSVLPPCDASPGYTKIFHVHRVTLDNFEALEKEVRHPRERNTVIIRTSIDINKQQNVQEHISEWILIHSIQYRK